MLIEKGRFRSICPDYTFVRFMSLCNRIFGDIIFTFCPIKLKLTSVISMTKTNSEAKFQLDSTTDEEFPHIPQLYKLPAFATL